MKTDDRLYDFLFLFHRFINFPTHLRVTIPIKLHRSRFIMKYIYVIALLWVMTKECLYVMSRRAFVNFNAAP